MILFVVGRSKPHKPNKRIVANPEFPARDFSVIDVASESLTGRVRLGGDNDIVAQFSGHPSEDHQCLGDAMVLSDDGSVLFVAYHSAQQVVAW